jgi:hypothetical protein
LEIIAWIAGHDPIEILWEILTMQAVPVPPKRPTRFARGTEGSNPPSSGGESRELPTTSAARSRSVVAHKAGGALKLRAKASPQSWLQLDHG